MVKPNLIGWQIKEVVPEITRTVVCFTNNALLRVDKGSLLILHKKQRSMDFCDFRPLSDLVNYSVRNVFLVNPGLILWSYKWLFSHKRFAKLAHLLIFITVGHLVMPSGQVFDLVLKPEPALKARFSYPD